MDLKFKKGDILYKATLREGQARPDIEAYEVMATPRGNYKSLVAMAPVGIEEDKRFTSVYDINCIGKALHFQDDNGAGASTFVCFAATELEAAITVISRTVSYYTDRERQASQLLWLLGLKEYGNKLRNSCIEQQPEEENDG